MITRPRRSGRSPSRSTTVAAAPALVGRWCITISLSLGGGGGGKSARRVRRPGAHRGSPRSAAGSSGGGRRPGTTLEPALHSSPTARSVQKPSRPMFDPSWDFPLPAILAADMSVPSPPIVTTSPLPLVTTGRPLARDSHTATPAASRAGGHPPPGQARGHGGVADPNAITPGVLRGSAARVPVGARTPTCLLQHPRPASAHQAAEARQPLRPRPPPRPRTTPPLPTSARPPGTCGLNSTTTRRPAPALYRRRQHLLQADERPPL